MKPQTTKERTAIKAVFLLGNAIDGINQSTAVGKKAGRHFHSAVDLPDAAHELAKSIVSINRKKASCKISQGKTWEGWSCNTDELIDDAGNRYGISEIRAIFTQGSKSKP